MDGKSMDFAETLFAHVETLYPICRSITGKGLRQTLRYVPSHIPAEMREVPSGTPVLDWQVPLEWNVRRRRASETLARARRSSNFPITTSICCNTAGPVDQIVPIKELQKHLHSIPDQPDLIPYRTAYYSDTWGFCLQPPRPPAGSPEPAYHVQIDTRLPHGSLYIWECFLPEQGPEEVLFRCIAAIPLLPTTIFRESPSRSSSPESCERREALLATHPVHPRLIGAITWLHFNRDAPSVCVTASSLPASAILRRRPINVPAGTMPPIDRYAASGPVNEGLR